MTFYAEDIRIYSYRKGYETALPLMVNGITVNKRRSPPEIVLSDWGIPVMTALR